ncbi:MAG TPA: hypothetical protein VKB46_23850 [Pyrinomonadaceae bacterium]|nr:hypothetical protein [Pyrinomonadaceae bacterium]
MPKKPVSLLLALLLVVLNLYLPTPTRAQSATEVSAAQKARTTATHLGVNPDKRVEVKLRDKTKLKGYITAVAQDSFTLTDAQSGVSKTVAYADVSEIKKASKGWSTKAWLILAGVGVGAIVTFIAVKPALCDGGAQTRGIC